MSVYDPLVLSQGQLYIYLSLSERWVLIGSGWLALNILLYIFMTLTIKLKCGTYAWWVLFTHKEEKNHMIRREKEVRYESRREIKLRGRRSRGGEEERVRVGSEKMGMIQICYMKACICHNEVHFCVLLIYTNRNVTKTFKM